VDARLHDLSIDEKLQLIEELWASIGADPNALPLTAADREELDQRLAAFESDGDVGGDATRVLEEIRQRLEPCAFVRSPTPSPMDAQRSRCVRPSSSGRDGHAEEHRHGPVEPHHDLVVEPPDARTHLRPWNGGGLVRRQAADVTQTVALGRLHHETEQRRFRRVRGEGADRDQSVASKLSP